MKNQPVSVLFHEAHRSHARASSRMRALAVRPLLLLGLILFVGVAGCASPPITATLRQAEAAYLYVVRREQHTGIAIDVAQWPDPAWSLLADFPEARFLEFGRGDAIYYQAREKTLSMTLGAALWPSPAVIVQLAVV